MAARADRASGSLTAGGRSWQPGFTRPTGQRYFSDLSLAKQMVQGNTGPVIVRSRYVFDATRGG